jgi:phosphate-selective porin OprO/OprP
MKRRYLLLLSLLCLGLSAFTQEKNNGFSSYWNNGFKIESADKRFQLKFGGRIMYDMAFFSQDDAMETTFGRMINQGEFRRIRFFNSGHIFNNVKYKFQLDFAGGEAEIKDAFIQLSSLPVIGNFRAGQFKEPFRLEVLTSSKYGLFMERSEQVAFFPERGTGVMVFNEGLNGRIGWQFGFFNDELFPLNGPETPGGHNLTGRLTGLLFRSEEKAQLIHLGIGFSHRNPPNQEYKISARTPAHLAPKYITTSTMANVHHIDLANAEASIVLGPFSIQGEILRSRVVQEENFALNYTALYGQLGYFLTGEHRNYKSSYEGFSRVKPKKNFGKKGAGAWELALRYSNIQLNKEEVKCACNGQQMDDLTAGINWYLNPGTRWMFNYVFASLENEGNTHIFQTRLQVDF